MGMQLLLTLAVLLIAFAGLAVGVILSDKKELKGSCGGPDINPDCCQTCPDKDACDDVKDLDLEVPPAAGRPVPAGLAQAPSSSSDQGRPVATPR